jgi:hypothetical protein
MLTPACLSRPNGRTLVSVGLLLLALTTSTTPSISCPYPDDLVVTGPERKKALEQLQASVNRCLSLRIDEQSGNVLCERNRKSNGHFVSLTKEGKRLAEVIDDNTVLVNIIASDSMVTSTKKLSFGGSYLGNSFTGTYGYTDDPAVKVPVIATRQQVDPETARMISDYYGKPGADMLHEIIESYLGGKYAQQKKIADTAGNLYYSVAHPNSTPQSGPIYIRYLDKENKETVERSEVYYVDLYVKSDDQPEKLIRRLYKDKSK